MHHQSGDDPDDLVQKNHITNMSHQMHVPDSITIGPNRTAASRIHQDNDRLSVRMEVPDSIRLGDNVSNGTKYSLNNDTNHSSESTKQQISSNQSDIEGSTDDDDDDYSAINPPRNNQQHQPIQIADSWHIEPFNNTDDKNMLNKFQLLQNRIHHIEKDMVRRDFRDRIVYTCIFGFFLLQTILSVRRSMLN